MENVETTVKMVNAHRHSRSTTIAAKRQSLISSSPHFSQSQLLASNLLLLFSVLASSCLHVLNFSYALIALTFIHFRIQLSIFEVHLTSNILFSVLVFARTNFLPSTSPCTTIFRIRCSSSNQSYFTSSKFLLRVFASFCAASSNHSRLQSVINLILSGFVSLDLASQLAQLVEDTRQQSARARCLVVRFDVGSRRLKTAPRSDVAVDDAVLDAR